MKQMQATTNIYEKMKQFHWDDRINHMIMKYDNDLTI